MQSHLLPGPKVWIAIKGGQSGVDKGRAGSAWAVMIVHFQQTHHPNSRKMQGRGEARPGLTAEVEIACFILGQRGRETCVVSKAY